jgi:hypothetical protein
MLVLCQLRRFQRGKDMVAYPPPLLQDFRETEVIGNEASLAFAVWRQRDPEGLTYMGDTSQFRVLKNRYSTTASRRRRATSRAQLQPRHAVVLGWRDLFRADIERVHDAGADPWEGADDAPSEDDWAN